MSNKALNWAFEAAIPPGPKFVLVALADHAGDHRGEDWTCFPSVERLMEFTSQSNATVRRHLDWLASAENGGWISKARREGRSRDDENGVYLFTLHRAAGQGPALNLSGEQLDHDRSKRAVEHRSNEGSAPLNLDGSTAQNEQSPCTPYNAEPPKNPQEPGVRVGARAPDDGTFEGLPGDNERRAAAAVAEAAYRRLSERWIEIAPGRVADGKARLAFSAALAEGFDPELIVACAERFLTTSPDAKAGKVVMLHTWLADKRWRGFEPKEGSASAAASGGEASPKFEGPSEVVGRICAMKGRDWFVSWLARCDWDDVERAIVARGDFTADRIRRDLRPLLEELKIAVIVRRAA